MTAPQIVATLVGTAVLLTFANAIASFIIRLFTSRTRRP